jgi:hypothetical protein
MHVRAHDRANSQVERVSICDLTQCLGDDCCTTDSQERHAVRSLCVGIHQYWNVGVEGRVDDVVSGPHVLAIANWSHEAARISTKPSPVCRPSEQICPATRHVTNVPKLFGVDLIRGLLPGNLAPD